MAGIIKEEGFAVSSLNSTAFGGSQIRNAWLCSWLTKSGAGRPDDVASGINSELRIWVPWSTLDVSTRSRLAEIDYPGALGG